MNTQKFSTLALKLKRHGLHFNLDTKNQQFVIGATKNALGALSVIYLLMLLFSLLVAGLSYVQYSGALGFRLSRVIYVALMLFLIGFVVYLYNYSLKYWENKEHKTFTSSEMRIQRKVGEVEVPREDIEEVSFEIEDMKNAPGNAHDLYQGRLFVQTKGDARYRILSLHGETSKFLEDDLTFIQGTLKEFWDL